jgi:hypothetical protein
MSACVAHSGVLAYLFNSGSRALNCCLADSSQIPILFATYKACPGLPYFSGQIVDIWSETAPRPLYLDTEGSILDPWVPAFFILFILIVGNLIFLLRPKYVEIYVQQTVSKHW